MIEAPRRSNLRLIANRMTAFPFDLLFRNLRLAGETSLRLGAMVRQYRGVDIGYHRLFSLGAIGLSVPQEVVMRLVFIALLACLVCVMPDRSRAEPSVAEFTPPPFGSYRFISDQVMGGVSEGEARIEEEAGARYLRLTGTVSTANRGGFLQARVDLETPLPGTALGVVLRVRGTGGRYFVHLRTRGTVLPWQYYQAGFEVTSDWQEVRIPFTAFVASGALLRDTPDPASVTSLAAVAYGRDHVADLAFQWVGLY